MSVKTPRRKIPIARSADRTVFPTCVRSVSTAKTPWWMPLLIVLAAVACYSTSFNGTFVFDDRPSNSLNFGLSQTRLADFSFLRQGRPVGMLTFVLNYRLHGVHVFGYHLVNLLIHILASLTLYFLLKEI